MPFTLFASFISFRCLHNERLHYHIHILPSVQSALVHVWRMCWEYGPRKVFRSFQTHLYLRMWSPHIQQRCLHFLQSFRWLHATCHDTFLWAHSNRSCSTAVTRLQSDAQLRRGLAGSAAPSEPQVTRHSKEADSLGGTDQASWLLLSSVDNGS